VAKIVNIGAICTNMITKFAKYVDSVSPEMRHVARWRRFIHF